MTLAAELDNLTEFLRAAWCADASPPDNSCSPANKGTGGESGGAGSSKSEAPKKSALVRRIEKQAAGITFSDGDPPEDSSGDTEYEFDVDYAREHLSSRAERRMGEWVNERVDREFELADVYGEVDDDDVYSEANATALEITDKVQDIVDEADLDISDESKEDLKNALADAVTSDGLDGVDEAIAKLADDHQGDPLYYGLSNDLNGYRDDLESKIEDTRESLQETANDQAVQGWYEDYDRSELEEEWLEQNAAEWDLLKPIESDGEDGEKADNTWYTGSNPAELRFHTSDGDEYEISAYEEHVGDHQGTTIIFTDERGSVSRTGAGNAHEVFRNVVPGTVAYIREKDLDFATFSAEEQSRIDLYDALAKTVAKVMPEYTVRYADSVSTRYINNQYVQIPHREYYAVKRDVFDEIVKEAGSRVPQGEGSVLVGAAEVPTDQPKSVPLPANLADLPEIEPEVDPAWFTEEYWRSKPADQKAAWCADASPPDNSCSPANKGEGGEKPARGQRLIKRITSQADKVKFESGSIPESSEDVGEILDSLSDDEQAAMDEWVDNEIDRENERNENPTGTRRDLEEQWVRNHREPPDESKNDNTWFTQGRIARLNFHTSDGSKYEMAAFGGKLDEFVAADIQFRDETGRFDLTGRGHAHEVFRAVVPNTVAYIREKDLDMATFSAEGQSRIDLYDKLATTVAKVMPEYTVRYEDGTNIFGDPKRYYYSVKRDEFDDIAERIKERSGKGAPAGTLVGAADLPTEQEPTPLPANLAELPEIEGDVDPAWFTAEYWSKQQKAAWCPGASPPDNSCSPANKGEGGDGGGGDSGSKSSESSSSNPATKANSEAKSKATAQVNEKLEGYDTRIAEIQKTIDSPMPDSEKYGGGAFDNKEDAERAIAKLKLERDVTAQSLESLNKPTPDLKAEWEHSSERVDEMVKGAAGGEVEVDDEDSEPDMDLIYQQVESDLTYDDISSDEQSNAYMAWIESGEGSESYEQALDSVKETVEEQINEDLDEKDYTIQVLEEVGSEFGIDPTTYSVIANKEGEIDPTYIVFTDGTSGAEAEARWSAIESEWQEKYDEHRDAEKADRMEEFTDDPGSSKWADELYELESQNKDEIWNNLSDSEKLSWVSEDAKGEAIQEKIDSGDYDSDSPSGVALTSLEVPSTYQPFTADDSSTEYRQTQSVARYVQLARAREIAVERGLSPDNMGELNREVWSAWKGSSTSKLGNAFQLACCDELGSEGKPELQANRFQVLKDAGLIDSSGDQSKYEELKAYVRGTWESSQYVLEQAKVEKVNTWRAVFIPDSAIEAADKEESKGRTRLTDIELFMNGAQSATSEASVANGWGGIGSTYQQSRIVLRIESDATSVISLPVHGQNLKNEHEVVLSGVNWVRSEAWLSRAPITTFRQDEEINGKTAA